MSGGSNVKLTFEHLLPNGSEAYMSYYDGYRGFNYDDMVLLTRKLAEKLYGNDSGFTNIMHGNADIYTIGVTNAVLGGTYGWIVAPSPSETFNLRSGIFAAGLATEQVFFDAYDASGHLIGSLATQIGDAGRTIDFASYGKAFKNVYALWIAGYTYGNGGAAVVMDNLEMHWNSPIPRGHGVSPWRPSFHNPHHHHVDVVHLFTQHAPAMAAPGLAGGPALYHGELTSIDAALGHADSGGGLTQQYSLPQIEHFGT